MSTKAMNIESPYPLISCICITRNRPELLLNSIISFEHQNYSNKELVISYPKTDETSKNLLERIIRLSQLNIIQVERDSEESLGGARNLAISCANGDYICTWDDDDWHHPERLTYQMNAIISDQQYKASVIRRVVLYDKATSTAHLSASYNWSGTLLCKKELAQQYPYLTTDRLEDIPLILFLESEKCLYHIEDTHQLYIYVNHGSNLLDPIHFRYFTRNGPEFNPEITKDIENTISTSFKIK